MAPSGQPGDRRRSLRTMADAKLRQRHPRHAVRQRHHGRVGRAAVQLGVLRRHPARDHAAPVRIGRVFPPDPGQLLVLDNEAYGPNDFTEFSVTAPTNARLPQSGQVISGFLDPIEIRAPQNVIKDASQFGTQKAHWNGFDASLDARLQERVVSAGRRRNRQDR